MLNKKIGKKTKTEVMPSNTNFLEALPPEARNKVNEKHILKMIENEERNQERSFTLSCLGIFSLLFVFLTVYLVPKDSELFLKVLPYLGVFAGIVFGSQKLKGVLNRKE